MSQAHGNSMSMHPPRPARKGRKHSQLGLALAIASCMAVTSAHAQGPVPRLGAGLTAPSGWVLEAADPARVSVRGPDGLSSIAIVVEEGALAHARERLSQTLVLPTIGELTPLGPVQSGRAMVSNRFLAPGAGPTHRAIVLARTAPAGRLIVLYGLTQPGLEADLNSAMLELAASAGLPSEPGRSPNSAYVAPQPDTPD